MSERDALLKAIRANPDDEWITADWLLSIGFVRCDGPRWYNGKLWVSHVQLEGGMYRMDWTHGDIPIPELPTRGDVRRLCASLGIPIKE